MNGTETMTALDDTRGRRATVVAVAMVAFVACYARVMVSLVDAWSTNYLYSYGFAIPFIAGYIAWTRAQTSTTRDDAPDYIVGVPVTGAGIGMLWVGLLGAIGALEQASLVVTLGGMVLLLFGRRTLRTHWFALACLLLMIPIWNYPIDLLQEPSRLLSTRIAVSILRVIGLPVLQQGTNIVLPEHTLAVLRECSGVNQLIAITAMVLPAAYLWLRTNSRRLAIIVIAVVVSYLGNGVRIALTGWLAVKGLSDGNPGTLHLSEGLAISALGYLVIGACFSFLASSERPAAVQSAGATEKVPHVPCAARRRYALDVAVLLALLLAGGASVSAVSREVPLRSVLSSLDMRIGDWVMEIGQEQAAVPLPAVDDALVGAYPTPAGMRRFAAVDDELVRGYRTLAGARAQLYVGYYRRQDQGKDLSGGLSHDLERAASRVALPGGVEIREIIQEKSGMSRGLFFWYDINGAVVGDIYRVKTRTIWDAMTRRRTNGAIVMVAWSAPSGTPSTAARQAALGFAQNVMPALQQHLPK